MIAEVQVPTCFLIFPNSVCMSLLAVYCWSPRGSLAEFTAILEYFGSSFKVVQTEPVRFAGCKRAPTRTSPTAPAKPRTATGCFPELRIRISFLSLDGRCAYHTVSCTAFLSTLREVAPSLVPQVRAWRRTMGRRAGSGVVCSGTARCRLRGAGSPSGTRVLGNPFG